MVTFIATTYNEKYDPYMFISSLLTQKESSWNAIIYSNGHNPNCKNIVEIFGDPRIKYLESETNRGAWGCYNRIDALYNHVVTKYVCQTSIQDYFTPNAVAEMLSDKDKDFVYWNSLHNHLDWNLLDSKLERGKIDWGNFMIKTEIAKKVNINQPNDFAADWFFINDCLHSGLITNIKKINKTLTIHN